MHPNDALDLVKKVHLIPMKEAKEFFYLGMAYLELNCWQNAIEAFEQALRIQPNDADAHFGLGQVFLACQDIEAAWQEYRILKDLNNLVAMQLLELICTNKVH